MKVEPTSWQWWLWPLRSRKIQVAITTVAVAYAAQAGLELREDVVLSVLAVGVALILGIAHEDAGRGGLSGPARSDYPGLPASAPDEPGAAGRSGRS